MPNYTNKEQSSPSYLRFQVCHTLDVSSVVPAPSGTLIRGLYPKCVCFHPTKPLMAVGVSGYLAVYDMQSNTRLGRVDLKSLPVEMAFAPDGSVIIVVVQDWILYSVSTSSWKARQVVPRRSKMDKPLESCLLAVAPGPNPFIYFCRYAKDTLRLATLPSRAGAGAADGGGGAGAGGGGPPVPSGGSTSSSSWGSRVKLDVQKAILGLACHPQDTQLLVLTADGYLRGYAIAGPVGEALAPLYSLQVQDPSDKVLPTAGVLTCVPHPALPGAALILQGSRVGSTTVLEAAGRVAPTVVMKGRVPGHLTSIGMGICRTNNTLLVFGHSDFGRVRCTAWRLSYRPGSVGLTLRPSRVDPQDFTPMLDVGRRTKASLSGAMAAGALAAAHAFVPGPAAAASAAGAAAAAATAATQPSGGAAAPPASVCHGLWGISPGWALDASSSYLLESGLGPSVSRVLVHPAFGLMAVVPDLPRACAANREVLFNGRAGLSGEELALARRTSTLVLMHVHNLEAPVAGWRGARLAPQHSDLAAWMPPGARSHSQQPGTAAAAAAAAGAAATAASPKAPQRPAGDSSDDEITAAEEPAAAAAAAEVKPRDKAAEAAEAAAASGHLALPPHTYYLAGNRLMKYSLVTRSACTLAQLPPDGPDGDARLPRQVLHSPRAGAWLVFFESGVTTGGPGGGAPATDHFTWSLINAASFAVEGGAGYVTWIRSGKSGCFLGPDDAHFCVMSANGKLLEVYDTASMSAATAAGSPLLSLALDGGVLMQGLGAPVFPGPPMSNAPVPEARAPPEAGPHDPRRFRGSGVVMWQSADMALNMTTLPALQRVPLEPPTPAPARPAATAYGDEATSDGPEPDTSPPVYPNMPMGHHFGIWNRQAHLPMLPHETVIHVTWQSLTLGGGGGGGGGGSGGGGGGGDADAVAAVLTSQRLLLVTAGLRVVCAVNLATHGSAILQEPLTSVMWAGPMLLVSTAAGQVLQLTWTGSLLPVATLSPAGFMALAGVTSDALLVLRTPLAVPPPAAAAAANTSGGGAGGGSANAPVALAEVVARPAALLQPLLIGWASLAATGLLSYNGGAAAAVRPALRQAFSMYDAVGFTPRGVWALIAAGAWDVAGAIASHMPPLDGAVRLAAAAAAGDWSEVSTALLAEASRALHAPAPPPRGSELHSKLVAAGAGALFHGQLATSASLFQAAGEWPAAMILAMCQGNSQALHTIAQKVGQQAQAGLAPGGAPGAPQSAEAQLAQQLASALRGVYGSVGTQVGDVALTLARPGQLPGASEPLERASRWPLALPQGAPAAVAVLRGLPRAAVPDAELGPIPSLADRSHAVSYYGLTATAAASVAAAGGGGGGGGFGFPGSSVSGGRTAGASSAATAAAADRAAGAASMTGSSSHKPGGSTALGDLEAQSMDSNDVGQGAAAADFFNQFGGGAGAGGFGRGPTTDFTSDDDSGSEATFGSAGPSRRPIKVQIRDPSAVAAPATVPSLREAVAGIRLAPPGGGGGGGSAAAAAAAPPPAAPPVAFPPGMSSDQLYRGGVARMEAGDWRSAAAHFSRAMSVLQHEERGALEPSAWSARLAFCAQYYAAVKLLEAVGGGAGPREARLYRYLAALALDDKHTNALLREAVTRNRTVGNYRYAADQLTALIVKVMDSAPAEYLAQMQAEIEECDRHGGRNAGIPSDEQVGDWAMLVRSAGEAGSKEDVDALVLPLLK